MGTLLSYSHKANTQKLKKWPVPNKLLVNPPEVKPPGNSSPPKLPGNLPQLPEVSRNHTGSDQVLSLSVRSGGTRNPPSSSSESFPSNDWSGKSPILQNRLEVPKLCCHGSSRSF